MPPFLSTFRSRTNSLLDNITGVIPESPSSSTSKDRSLTCGRCGNRFRDRLEMSLHFNLMPHHSDYKDSHDFDSFTRPKARRRRPVDEPISSLTASASFSETQAHYDLAKKDKENDNDNASRPSLLRKLPTFANLTSFSTGDQSQFTSATDYIDPDSGDAFQSAKAKGKQKATPRLPRDGSFQYGVPLGSDEENDPPALTSRSSFTSIRSRSRARSATVQGLTSEPSSYAPPRASTSSFTSRSSGGSRQAPPLPPKLPEFDWQMRDEKQLPNFPDDADDTASINSDSSFRTAGSTGMETEKAQLKAYYAANEKSADKARDPYRLTSSSASTSSAIEDDEHTPANGKQYASRSQSRHGSQSNLLLEAIETHHEDAPPSYRELHGDEDPFDQLPSTSGNTSRHLPSRFDGYATMPTSPVSRTDLNAPRRPRRSASEWSSFTSRSRLPVHFSSLDEGQGESYSSANQRTADEDDLYSPRSEKGQSSWTRPAMNIKKTDGSLPSLIASTSYSTSPSPSTPKTPFAFFADAPLVAPPLSLPRLQQPTKSTSSAGRRSRQHSRAKSDAAAPSTRCPTCFAKFSSLDKTLEHLDNSDCGAVDFESGIV